MMMIIEVAFPSSLLNLSLLTSENQVLLCAALLQKAEKWKLSFIKIN